MYRMGCLPLQEPLRKGSLWQGSWHILAGDMAVFVAQPHSIFHKQPVHANELQQADMALSSSCKML